ncbi:hypothetical protein SprV_0200919100 [Sparganum proliferum]
MNDVHRSKDDLQSLENILQDFFKRLDTMKIDDDVKETLKEDSILSALDLQQAGLAEPGQEAFLYRIIDKVRGVTKFSGLAKIALSSLWPPRNESGFKGKQSLLEECFEVDVEYIDFRKAFDTVSRQRLLHKLSVIGNWGDLLKWIRALLVGRKQRVCIGDYMSDWMNVTSGVPQGSALGSLIFTLYVNSSLQELECGKIMFADDFKLCLFGQQRSVTVASPRAFMAAAAYNVPPRLDSTQTVTYRVWVLLVSPH